MTKKSKSFNTRLLNNSRGASFVEYLLLALIIGVGCVVALLGLGNNTSGSYQQTADKVGDCMDGTC